MKSFKRNIKSVFDAFINFLQLAKDEQKEYVDGWFLPMNKMGDNPIIKLLNWVVFFQVGDFEERIFLF